MLFAAGQTDGVPRSTTREVRCQMVQMSSKCVDSDPKRGKLMWSDVATLIRPEYS